MLIAANIAANAVVFMACFWALFSNRVPTRTGGATILAFVAFGAFGNIFSPNACHSGPEVFFNTTIAAGVLRLFWAAQARPWIYKGS